MQPGGRQSVAAVLDRLTADYTAAELLVRVLPFCPLLGVPMAAVNYDGVDRWNAIPALTGLPKSDLIALLHAGSVMNFHNRSIFTITHQQLSIAPRSWRVVRLAKHFPRLLYGRPAAPSADLLAGRVDSSLSTWFQLPLWFMVMGTICWKFSTFDSMFCSNFMSWS